MITQLEVFTPRVTVAPLPVTDGSATTDPIQIRNIDGLGPVKAEVNTGQYGTISGEFYRGSYTGKRNIVIFAKLNPNWADQSVESLRAMLYTYFMPQNEVLLRFTSSHMAEVEITGVVESCDPNMFTNDPEMVISIVCPKSEFIGSSLTVFSGETIALPDGIPFEIDYLGTLPTGFVVDVVPNDSVPSMTNGEIRVINETPDASVPDIFIVSSSIDNTKYFELCTVQGNKYVRNVAVPSGAKTSLLGKQVYGSTWIQLKQGLNKFRVASATPGLTWSLQYLTKYGGI